MVRGSEKVDAIYPSTPTLPASSRMLIDRITAGFPESRRFVARLLVSEACANSVRHAGRGGRVRVVAVRDEGLLTVEVHDEGPGFDPAEQLRRQVPQSWGLRLLEALADRWGVRRDPGTCVWFEVTLGEP